MSGLRSNVVRTNAGDPIRDHDDEAPTMNRKLPSLPAAARMLALTLAAATTAAVTGAQLLLADRYEQQARLAAQAVPPLAQAASAAPAVR